MFNGYGNLQLDGDHLDLSYRQPELWPAFTPKGSIRSFVFEIGDAEKGPVIQLGLMTAVADEVLDWPHSIDPPHFHGSDQFRLVVGGAWELAGKLQQRGGYSLQESGRIYREHPGPEGAAWLMLVIGDRRGAKAEIIRSDDLDSLIDIDNEYFQPSNEDGHYHPAGPKGIAAIRSTDGDCVNGYLRKAVSDLASNSASSHLLGDEQAGPLTQILNYSADTEVLPASQCATERLLVISQGSCTIGERCYQAGDLRLQQADTLMPAIVSGSEGVHMAMVVADRRAAVTLAEPGDAAPKWLTEAQALNASH